MDDSISGCTPLRVIARPPPGTRTLTLGPFLHWSRHLHGATAMSAPCASASRLAASRISRAPRLAHAFPWHTDSRALGASSSRAATMLFTAGCPTKVAAAGSAKGCWLLGDASACAYSSSDSLLLLLLSSITCVDKYHVRRLRDQRGPERRPALPPSEQGGNGGGGGGGSSAPETRLS